MENPPIVAMAWAPNTRVTSALRAAIIEELPRKKRKEYSTSGLEEKLLMLPLKESQFLKEIGYTQDIAECLPN